MKKVMLVFGTRPEAIKMCPLVNELKKRSTFQTIVLVTAQHREMLDQVLDFFRIVPEYDLDIMKDRQTLFDITIEILNSIRIVLEKERPDVVLIHGDTTTAFAVSVACFYLKIPIGHIEAGLRTYDIYAPFPEEFNREVISIISRYYFAPTFLCRDNLLREGRNEKNIFVTGNTIVDSMKYTVRSEYIHPELEWVGDSKLIFITAHRRESIGEPMHCMFRAIRRVLEKHPDCKAIYPIHRNPLVRSIAEEEFRGCGNIHIVEPMDVVDCHNFESRSYLCLTDSGGVQEECPSFGVPVLVMRDTTERIEGIRAGALKLVGTDEERIYKEFSFLLENDSEYKRMHKASNPYGDGNACERIADILEGKKVLPWECFEK
ncbi:UDP-N-Acetylglucosamine 2-epimerase [Lachnospiraceae bacterium KH1T2]|nr:UDP-N-Acetylglucosamine 2-epimerase [Lachnospiraceae bacterium KH1T2]